MGMLSSLYYLTSECSNQFSSNSFMSESAFPNEYQLIKLIIILEMQLSGMTKNQSNGSLLKILTKRKAQSLTQIKRQWPGKLAPSFTNNIRKKAMPLIKPNKIQTQEKRSQKSGDKKQNKSTHKEFQKSSKFFGTESMKMIRKIPIVKMGSVSLSIQPSSRSSKIISQKYNKTWRTNATNPQNNLRFTRNLSYKDAQKIVDRSHADGQNIQFVNNRLTTALEKSRASRDLQIQQQNHYLQNLKQNIIEDLSKSSRSSVSNQLNNFIVDYSTFNYIDKVIDNPELWKNFVRKKTKTPNKIEDIRVYNKNVKWGNQ